MVMSISDLFGKDIFDLLMNVVSISPVFGEDMACYASSESFGAYCGGDLINHLRCAGLKCDVSDTQVLSE